MDGVTPAELAEQNMGLVHHVVRKTGWDRRWPRDELVSIGYLALVKAAHGWNPERGAFSTYAERAILNSYRQYAKDERRHHEHTVHADEHSYDESPWLAVEDARLEGVVDRVSIPAAMQAVTHLTTVQREIIEELYLRGKSAIGLAQERGIRRNAVYAARDRALRRLREAVGA